MQISTNIKLYIVLAGDFNFDALKTRDTIVYNNLKSLLYSFDLAVGPDGNRRYLRTK